MNWSDYDSIVRPAWDKGVENQRAALVYQVSLICYYQEVPGEHMPPRLTFPDATFGTYSMADKAAIVAEGQQKFLDWKEERGGSPLLPPPAETAVAIAALEVPDATSSNVTESNWLKLMTNERAGAVCLQVVGDGGRLPPNVASRFRQAYATQLNTRFGVCNHHRNVLNLALRAKGWPPVQQFEAEVQRITIGNHSLASDVRDGRRDANIALTFFKDILRQYGQPQEEPPSFSGDLITRAYAEAPTGKNP